MQSFKFLFLLLIAVQLNSQELKIAKEKTLWNDFTYDMGNVFEGVGHSYSRPFHWKGNDWANLGYMAAGTAVLFAVDDEVDHWVDGFREDVPGFLVDYGNRYGNPQNNYMFTGGVYLAGLFTKNEKLRRTGVLLVSSATAIGFLQQVSARMIGRARPKSGDSSSVYDPFQIGRIKNYDAFPSGHTMLAFTNAYAIAKQFKNPWVKAGIYTVGMIPGFARITDRFHWISDVAFSTVLSIFMVETIDRYLDKKYDKKYNDSSKNLSWNLSFGPNRVGVAVQF
ncbi:phosphatase PAP2 family protein [Flagellimonas hymeniacidonis]|uniref:Phosphatase PAP2 family protein n=1 Tax=Flagellimonas hymeniacidonis TaxID=2603628 RepID=A0A5C8V6H3_9FLAO|nr:phosphatase PAP2 family protein [Flagellimonas hymeniacidonis]TXN37351.1 phosphatase PAP2 family protein [Flagellimonas hymeniacidonis]